MAGPIQGRRHHAAVFQRYALTDITEPRSGEAYRALVAARKSCRICVHRSPGRIRSCAEYAFDPEVVSHWEQWLGHKSPKLLIVGQDFGNVKYFEQHCGRDEPRNPTNLRLYELLKAAGLHTTYPPEPDLQTPVYATNSILCVKKGPMNASILSSWVNSCADAHLAPLVRYLRPPVVVGMGSHGWRAVRRVFALGNAPRFISAAAGGRWVAADRTTVFAVGHPGPLGLINRPLPQQIADWRRIGEAMSLAPGQSSLT
jgi:uracil-DNA glycosylase